MKNQTPCDYDRRIARAVKDNSLSDELKQHLAVCDDCRETRKIAAFFRTNAAEVKIPAKLPTAGFVWWKSQLQRKRAATNRAGQPILFVEIAAVVIFCLISIWLLSSLPESSINRILLSLEQLFLPIVGAVVVLGAVILSATLFFRRYLS